MLVASSSQPWGYSESDYGIKVDEIRFDDCLYSIYRCNGELTASFDKVGRAENESASRFTCRSCPSDDSRPWEILQIQNFINYEGNVVPVVEIGAAAFVEANSKFKLVHIPANIEVITPTAFYLAPVQHVIFSEDSKLKHICDHAFFHSSLECIAIPRSVISIGDEAFSAEYFYEVVFEEGSLLEEIGYSAFSETSLESITIPPKVRTIPVGCFSECDELRRVTILPDSELTEFGHGAFFKCTKLLTIDNLEKVTKLGDRCFLDCNKFNPVCSEEWQPEIEEFTFRWCAFGERFRDRIDQLTAARLARSNPDSTRP
jgi:hypothetical protein